MDSIDRLSIVLQDARAFSIPINEALVTHDPLAVTRFQIFRSIQNNFAVQECVHVHFAYDRLKWTLKDAIIFLSRDIPSLNGIACSSIIHHVDII